MHIKQIQLRNFKRFTNLTIHNISSSARLVVLCGPNGSGKSSIFDAFRMWETYAAGLGGQGADDQYHRKNRVEDISYQDAVRMEFHEPVPANHSDRQTLFYIRSSYRNEGDFSVNQISRIGSIFDGPKAYKMIDNDTKVSQNYQRLVSQTVSGVYTNPDDAISIRDFRENLIGQLRDPMRRLFDDLVLDGIGDPFDDGTFLFSKGAISGFRYKNLSGGEKAAFDILLDIIVKREFYDNSIYSIDEPEVHINTKLQARLLSEMMTIIPVKSQLWISTHAIGMLRRARDLASEQPGLVAFIDLYSHDFDSQVEIEPRGVDRKFWMNILDIALDDLAGLVAPRQVVLCEGKPASNSDASRSEFDARCYRTIFGAKYPDIDFLSMGSEAEVRSDKIQLGRSIQTLVSGTSVIKLIDRDDLSEAEVTRLKAEKYRILTRRHIESYLLDDEVLEKLCVCHGQPENFEKLISAKVAAIQEIVSQGKQNDDIKSASGLIYVASKRILGLTRCGNTAQAFMSDTLAPLISSDMGVFQQLDQDIFG